MFESEALKTSVEEHKARVARDSHPSLVFSRIIHDTMGMNEVEIERKVSGQAKADAISVLFISTIKVRPQ